MKKKSLTILALILALSVMLAGCGSKDAAPTTAAPAVSENAGSDVPTALGLKEATLSATTWSSPNGATVHLSAVPVGYTESCSASFVVRLESEEVANIPCQWDGEKLTAEAELNAADGLCYYLVMTGSTGNTVELAVNTPTQITDEALINMADALNAYCSVMVDSSAFEDGKLTISAGTVQVQTPRITNAGESITCKEAVLVLSLNGEELDKAPLSLAVGDTASTYTQTLSGLSFRVPELENDQQLTLTLQVTLSNGQTLSDAGSTFYYNDGNVLTAVG